MKRLLSLLCLFVILNPASGSAQQSTLAKQAYVIDFETGQVLLHKNEDEKMPTSSMSKVMTMYMVFDALKNGAITMESKFPVSEKAWRMGGSKMFVELGKDIDVKDLVQGVIIQSGNDATIVLAEGIAGSEAVFAERMTDKAHEIGMAHSNFVNASGWPDPNHYSTAHDLSIMARHMIEGYPEYYKYFSQREFTYNSIKQGNRNPLLYRDIGADGLKTGHTEIAGYGLIGTAVRDGRRVVMVVNGLTSEQERADESARLINWALDNFTNVDLLKANVEIAKAPVAMGKLATVGLMVKDNVKLTVPRMEKNNITLDLKYKSPLVAPIAAGQEVGVLQVNIPSMEPQVIPLYAASAVEEVGFFKKTLGKLENLVFGRP